MTVHIGFGVGNTPADNTGFEISSDVNNAQPSYIITHLVAGVSTTDVGGWGTDALGNVVVGGIIKTVMSTAATARTNLGGTTAGQAFFTLTNPGAITFPRINADNTVSALSAADFRTAIGVGAGGGDALTSNPLSQFAATTSAQLRGVLSDETGTGLAYFQNGDLGTPSAGVLTNCTGTASGLTSGTATNSVNAGVTDDNATNVSAWLTWVTANSGSTPIKISSTKLGWNPSTGILTCPAPGGFTGALNGNAATADVASTATVLVTPRTINGVSFDGSANITVTAAAGTLSGATLNATVTASSLTSLGTLTGLAETISDAATSTYTSSIGATFGHNTSGTAAGGFGTIYRFKLEDSTTPDMTAFDLAVTWQSATHAAPRPRIMFFAYDLAAREVLRMGANGTDPTIGFFGSTEAAQQTGDVGTALATFGLMGGTPTFAGANVTGTVAAATSAGTCTGNAATATALATGRSIYGNNFDGTANLFQVIGSAFGGTGNGFAKISGPTTSEKTFTLPDATCTILTSNTAVTVAQGGSGRTSTTAYMPICGGTTTTAAEQSVATGTAGQALTYVSSSAVPTFQWQGGHVCEGLLTAATGNPVYKPRPATPSSTTTLSDLVTFATAHGWTTGTMITPVTTGGGLTTGTTYYVNALSTTTCAFYTTLANAEADTSRVDLTANITQELQPFGVQSTTLKFSPFNGNRVRVCDGTNWSVKTFTELSLALTATASTNYDVYLDDDATTLSIVAWTNATTRATDLVLQDGVWVKSGDTTKLWLGTIRASATNTMEDSGYVQSNTVKSKAARQFIYNAYNRQHRKVAHYDGNTHTYNGAALQAWNADSAVKIEVLFGQPGDVLVSVNAPIKAGTAGSACYTAIGLDSTSVQYGAALAFNYNTNYVAASFTQNVCNLFGYHAISLLEFGHAGTASTFASIATIEGTVMA